jgi:peptidoglycan/xylan/chitin deacetylase (PgdA/CDA1 family)
LSIRSRLGVARRRVLCSLERRMVPLETCEPIISFTFDDFPRTAYLTGGAILERFGAHGTFYAACGLMNTTNELGDQFRVGDIDSLLDNGHDLASHTYSHTSARAVSCSAFCEDVEKGRRAVEELTGMESPNFAYPFGHVTLRTKRALAANLTTARSIFGGFNGPEADLNLLRAHSLYGHFEARATAEKLIAENVRRKTWLIFYTHDIRPDPSPYGCTPALFEAAVSCAARSGCRILTVREALAECGVQNGNPEVHVRQPVLA